MCDEEEVVFVEMGWVTTNVEAPKKSKKGKKAQKDRKTRSTPYGFYQRKREEEHGRDY